MSRIPYSPRVETWNAVDEFPSTSLGIVPVRYRSEKPVNAGSFGQSEGLSCSRVPPSTT
jgi:hypothetical protein